MPKKANVRVGARTKPATPPSAPSRQLDVFPNPAPERDYVIRFEVPEFTCLCPLTGQPDFAHFTIEYIADRHCVETKSLKQYFWSYRNEGAFHEKVTNTILSDLVAALQPRYARIHADWFVRGGIRTYVTAEHRAKGWKAAPRAGEAPTPTPGCRTCARRPTASRRTRRSEPTPPSSAPTPP